MKKYCLLQLKRVARFLPWALCAALVLFGCMSLMLHAITNDAAGRKGSKVCIGVVGTAGNSYLQWGLAAMQFDSTAMSLELEAMEEPDAIQALERGDIAAFVVFPEEFVEDAMIGEVGQLRLVSTVGATGMVSLIKEEVTVIVDKILSACENGSYGAGDAAADNGLAADRGKHINDLAVEYVDFLFDRSRMYRVENLAQDQLPIGEYMLGGLSALLMMLCCLPFAPLYIRRDQALAHVLRARGVELWKQTLGEFGAYFAALLALLAVVAAVLCLSGLAPGDASVAALFAGMVPALLLVASLSFCLYAVSDHLIGGMLLSFFVMLALGFVGGCMYPIHIFPRSLQRLGALVPSGIVRRSITDCLVSGRPTAVLPLLGCSGLLLIAAGVLRAAKAGRGGR